MTKTIVCPECNGFGHINRGCENGSWSVLCSSCNGRGVLRVPMTNADRIRNMSDDELAHFLLTEVSNEKCCGICHGSCTGNDCINGIMQWLNSEVAED